MPNTSGQAELLFKISLGAADTGPNRAGSLKQFYEEALPSRPVVFSTSVWSDVDKIPLTAPVLAHEEISGVVQYFENVPFLALEGQANPDTGFPLPDAKQAFYLPDLRDSIPFNFSPNGSYAYKIKKASGSNVAFGEGDWVLDVASGLLNFYGGLPEGVTLASPPTISFYKYVGSKGGGGGGASITISETAPEGVEAGAMWWNSITGDLLLYYSDGDSSQWVSAIGGVGGLWTLNSSTSTITTAYNIAKAGGSFKIPHPLPELTESHFLYHSFVEGPRADLIYRGEVQLVNGRATINIDRESKMTDGTFEALSRNPSCFTTNETDWTPVRGKVKGNLLEIESQDPNAISTVSWLVISERKDPAACNLEWTDSEGYASPEVLKESIKPEEKPKLDPIILRTSL
jgi:hypothetical protein